MQQYLVYALIFAAVLSVLWVGWRLADEVGLVEGEKRDFENNSAYADGRQKKPLERFVSPGRLFRLQIAFALLPGLLVPGCFLLAGFASPVFLLCFGLVCGFAGWKLVRFYFERLVRRRQTAFESAILDLTTGLANVLKAGMAFPEALKRIAARTHGPMREELAIVNNECKTGTDMPMALDRLVERMPCEDIRLLAASVRLTAQTGGSLADVLVEMADVIRRRREFADKVKALTAQGRFEGYVLGCMPLVAFALFYLIQPEIMSGLFKTVVGWTAIGVTIVLEAIGFMVISKIATVDV